MATRAYSTNIIPSCPKRAALSWYGSGDGVRLNVPVRGLRWNVVERQDPPQFSVRGVVGHGTAAPPAAAAAEAVGEEEADPTSKLGRSNHSPVGRGEETWSSSGPSVGNGMLAFLRYGWGEPGVSIQALGAAPSIRCRFGVDQRADASSGGGSWRRVQQGLMPSWGRDGPFPWMVIVFLHIVVVLKRRYFLTVFCFIS
jgi:hypothetical protein